MAKLIPIEQGRGKLYVLNEQRRITMFHCTMPQCCDCDGLTLSPGADVDARALYKTANAFNAGIAACVVQWRPLGL